MKGMLRIAAAVAIAAFIGFTVSSARAANASRTVTIATFQDSVGEAAGAPDIGAVTVSLDGKVLMVEAKVSGMPEVLSEGSVMFLLNTDRDRATGEFQGADYLLFMDTKTLEGSVLHWSGTEYVDAQKVADPSRTLISATSAGFLFNLANLGSPNHIELSMMVLKGTAETGLMDIAPDAGMWPFDAVAPTPVAVTPVIGSPLATPAAPTSGKRVTVTFPVTRSDDRQPLTEGKMICDPSVAGKVITHAESFVGGKARLSFLVPKTAKGRLLKVKVTIVAAGGSATKIATFRVK